MQNLKSTGRNNCAVVLIHEFDLVPCFTCTRKQLLRQTFLLHYQLIIFLSTWLQLLEQVRRGEMVSIYCHMCVLWCCFLWVGLRLYVILKWASQVLKGFQGLLSPFKGEHLEMGTDKPVCTFLLQGNPQTWLKLSNSLVFSHYDWVNHRHEGALRMKC